MSTTAIQWTDRVWNPVTGCTKVSQGCKHCYAETVAGRFFATQYPDVPVGPALPDGGPTAWRPRRFTDVQTHEDRLLEPMRWWRKPGRVFVNSMSDLFHEAVPFEFIDRVFAVMALADRQTFQVLTKRPQRMREYLSHPDVGQRVAELAMAQVCRGSFDSYSEDWTAEDAENYIAAWPLPNVWLGVSVEDQATADERVPLLLDTPAAVRFVSYEPALGPVDFTELPSRYDNGDGQGECNRPLLRLNALKGGHWCGGCFRESAHLDWVIVGGESGPGARTFAIEWADLTVRQCREAGVAVFVKQLGAHVVSEGRSELQNGQRVWQWRAGLRDRKGGDPAEWPEHLRVREFPR